MKNLTPEQIDAIRHWIQDVKDQFQREADQGILKRDLYQSVEAMGGRDACDRIRREIDARVGMIENATRVLQMQEQSREQRKRANKR